MQCPNCGSKLELMNVNEYEARLARIPADETDRIFDLQFNCEECTHDWHVEVALPAGRALEPIFWG